MVYRFLNYFFKWEILNYTSYLTKAYCTNYESEQLNTG